MVPAFHYDFLDCDQEDQMPANLFILKNHYFYQIIYCVKFLSYAVKGGPLLIQNARFRHVNTTTPLNKSRHDEQHGDYAKIHKQTKRILLLILSQAGSSFLSISSPPSFSFVFFIFLVLFYFLPMHVICRSASPRHFGPFIPVCLLGE